jgi:hypothetical protein
MDVRPGGIFSIDIAVADGQEVPNPSARDEADLEKNKTSGFYQGTEIAVDQFVEHVIAMK